MVTMQVKIERVENGMQEDGSAEPYYKVSFWGGVFCLLYSTPCKQTSKQDEFVPSCSMASKPATARNTSQPKKSMQK